MIKIANEIRNSKAAKLLAKFRARDAYVKVGILSGDNAELAAIHEYGTSTIPARPFIGPAVLAKSADYRQFLREEFAAATDDKSYLRALGKLGQRASNDIRNYVTQGNNLAPNAPSTVAQKGSDRPLVDTGQLIRSVSYEVVS